MHWFSGIDGNTQMRDIGWCYVFVAMALLFIIYLLVKLHREWRR